MRQLEPKDLAMTRLIDSVMETMNFLGSSVSEIVSAVEALSPVAPVPEKAFPESFYLPHPEVPPEEKTAREIMDRAELRRVRFYTEKDAHRLWKPYTPHTEDRRQNSEACRCGHGYSEHLPCCVHLVEGCACEEYHPVNAVAEGA